jgi:hypothetical protein
MRARWWWPARSMRATRARTAIKAPRHQRFSRSRSSIRPSRGSAGGLGLPALVGSSGMILPPWLVRILEGFKSQPITWSSQLLFSSAQVGVRYRCDYQVNRVEKAEATFHSANSHPKQPQPADSAIIFENRILLRAAKWAWACRWDDPPGLGSEVPRICA